RNFACFKDGTYYSKTYQVGKTTFRLIFLDDIFFSFRPEENMKNPYMDKFQLCWLRDQLHESGNDIEIILMHIPFTDFGQQEPSNELYSMLEANPSVKLILAGHQHKNIVEKYPSEGDNRIVQVQTGAFAGDINNWRQIKLTEDQILVSFPGKTENELTIPVK
ncbi:MAG: metallophosphoesterase, partial [Pedobacter sp.]